MLRDQKKKKKLNLNGFKHRLAYVLIFFFFLFPGNYSSKLKKTTSGVKFSRCDLSFRKPLLLSSTTKSRRILLLNQSIGSALPRSLEPLDSTLHSSSGFHCPSSLAHSWLARRVRRMLLCACMCACAFCVIPRARDRSENLMHCYFKPGGGGRGTGTGESGPPRQS